MISASQDLRESTALATLASQVTEGFSSSPGTTEQLEQQIATIISDDHLHCRWLNTLSMLENVGACKITESERYFRVTESVLKHAAEETRHAYYLKRQLRKLTETGFDTYRPEYLINALASYRYIHKLDCRISRLLREDLGLVGGALRRHAYVLVTYAIEQRADQVYGVYQVCLKAQRSKVSVRGIIAEEEQHLAEMDRDIDDMFDKPDIWKAQVCAIEQALFTDWHQRLSAELAVATAGAA